MNFQPHAVILTERTRPEPIFVAAIIGSERLLRVDFDLDGERESYIKKVLEEVRRRLAKWNGMKSCFLGDLSESLSTMRPTLRFGMTLKVLPKRYSTSRIGLVRRACY